jgi:hypothetical protein
MIHATWVLICPACDLSNEHWQPLIEFDLVDIPRCALSIASGNQPIWRCSNRSGDAGHMALAFRVVKGYRHLNMRGADARSFATTFEPCQAKRKGVREDLDEVSHIGVI